MDWLNKKNKIWILGLVFFVSLLLHLIGLAQAGRTWDEQFKFDLGYFGLRNLTKLQTNPEFWQEGLEHPMIGKYIYGVTAGLHLHPIFNQKDLTPKIIENLNNGKYTLSNFSGQLVLVDYDMYFPRLTSAILNSLGVVFTFLLAWELFSPQIALLSALILTLTPRFLAFGKQLSFESETIAFFMLFFYLFIKLINNKKLQQKSSFYIWLGIIAGMLIGIRYNNFFIAVFFPGLWILAQLKTKLVNFWQPRLLLIPLLAGITFLFSWPLLWNDPLKYFLLSAGQHKSRNILPSIYYLKYFIFTTPVLLLGSFLAGIGLLFKKIDFSALVVFWWVVSVFIFFSFFSSPTGGTRYIYFIHPGIAIISAIFWDWIIKLKSNLGLFLTLGFFGYLAIILFIFHPYYLDYYNELAGGTRGAIAKKLDFSWWGEGQKEAVLWLDKNAGPNSSVYLLVKPLYVTPTLRADIKINKEFDETNLADYLIVSFSEEEKIPQNLRNLYDIVYQVQVQESSLVKVFGLEK